MINIPEIIGNVVDTMRDSGTYESWTVVDTTYTITSTNNLTDLEWVSILDGAGSEFGEFQVTNISSIAFDIVSSTAPPASGLYSSLEPFCMYGHSREISNRLLLKDKDSVYKYQKYPLIALRLPVIEDVGQGGIHNVSLNIAILEFTDKNYSSPERYENVITPILMPLYLEFIEALNKNGQILNNGTFEHDKIDRLFYGIDELEGNTSYIFNDPLDGIELQNLELKIINKC